MVLTGGGGWFRSELWAAAAATRVLGRRGWMGGGAGVRGVFKGQGPWVSARKEGWEGRGDRGRTLLRGEIRGEDDAGRLGPRVSGGACRERLSGRRGRAGWLAPPGGAGAGAAWEQAGCWVLAWPRWAAAGQAGVERAGQGLGPRGGELGRPGEREREEEADRAGLGSGPRGRENKKNMHQHECNTNF